MAGLGMGNEQRFAALNAIARECNKELKTVNKDDLEALKIIIDKHSEKAVLIGFSKIEMIIQIGRINGRLVDRRLDGY
jgi:hypothetical protein